MSTTTPLSTDAAGYARSLAQQAATASAQLARTTSRQRTQALLAIAARLRAETAVIQAANAQDLAAGKAAGLAAAMLDRLKLDAAGVNKIADSVAQIAQQIDPVGQIIEGYTRPNGLQLRKMRVPIGVILMIYEARPNVTSDAAALCLKSGNAVILRGGKEALQSNLAIARCVSAGLSEAGLPAQAVQLIDTPDRAVVSELLKLEGLIDLCIPRGGESLIRAVVEQSRIPVIKHYTGNCHVYIDASADAKQAVDICVNAKTQRPGVCNAAETFLFHTDAVRRGLLAKVGQALLAKGVEIRGDERVRQAIPQAQAVTDKDWDTEYLDLIVAVGVVDSLDAAIAHINKHGSKHTDAIVTADFPSAQTFIAAVDSANVMVNASTRFSDGGEYGLGAEIGISTDKLHARGPMGAADLTTYKWVVLGEGQIRS